MTQPQQPVRAASFGIVQKSNRFKTFFLLFVMFLVLFGLISWTVYYLGGSSAWIVPIAVLISIAATWGAWWNSDKFVLRMANAKIVTREQAPQLYNMVEELTIASGLPMPKIAIVEDPAPNAFATGRDPAHGVVAFTTGLLEKMDREQIQGVAAHELAHIGNRDTLVMAVAATTAGIVAIMADMIFRATLFSGGRRQQGHPIMALVGIVALILAPLAASMLRASVSRKREWLADATAVAYTRNPQGLRRALETLRDDSTVVKQTSTSIAHVWIESPLAGGLGQMFSTHPPIDQRISALKKMGG